MGVEDNPSQTPKCLLRDGVLIFLFFLTIQILFSRSPSSSFIKRFLTTITMLKSKLWIGSYGLPKSSGFSLSTSILLPHGTSSLFPSDVASTWH
jgi:hypothetical protein